VLPDRRVRTRARLRIDSGCGPRCVCQRWRTGRVAGASRPADLADALLDDAGVAALSGTAFGDFGEGYLRFSVANSIENIEKALDRVGAWAQKNL
jgi:aspartate/methionine/tyrosine aminotransferase